MRIPLWLLLIGFFFCLVPAQAARDIVYAARYYYPPGSHRTSHFHLYRINPNGTKRTQLTYGKDDDSSPLWSPNGRWILYTRTGGRNDRAALCLLDSWTGRLRKIADGDDDGYDWSPDGRTIAVTHTDWDKGPWACSTTLIGVATGRTQRLRGITGVGWSPNSRRVCAHGLTDDEIINLASGRVTHLPSQDAVWLNNSFLVDLDDRGRKVFLVTWRTDGRAVRRVPCRWLKAPYGRAHFNPTDDPYLESINPGDHNLLPVLGGSRPFLYVQDVGNSGMRPCNAYYSADSRSGRLVAISSGQFFSWAPGGTRYCTASCRDLRDYGKIINGYQKSLYTASLMVGSTKTGKEREIVAGLVWVTGADWQKRKR